MNMLSMLKSTEYTPYSTVGTFYRSNLRFLYPKLTQSLASLLGCNHLLLGYANNDGDMLIFVDMLLHKVNCYDVALGLQVQLARHELIWSIQHDSIVYNTPMNVLVGNDIVALLLYEETNNEEESDEARYVDVLCDVAIYDIKLQQLTKYQDYHTVAMDNHHLVPTSINIASNTFTGSLVVIHSNQFIKFYYYGNGYEEIQDYYHVHSLNNYISEKKLFIPSHSTTRGLKSSNWFASSRKSPDITISRLDLSVFTNVFISYFYPNSKIRISGYECKYVSLCDNNLDVILVLTVSLASATSDSVPRVVTATLLFSPFYGTVITLKFIDLKEFVGIHEERYKRYLRDTWMLSNRDIAKAVSTLHAAFATSFYSVVTRTDRSNGNKLTNMPSLVHGSYQRIDHPWLPHSICL